MVIGIIITLCIAVVALTIVAIVQANKINALERKHRKERENFDIDVQQITRRYNKTKENLTTATNRLQEIEALRLSEFEALPPEAQQAALEWQQFLKDETATKQAKSSSSRRR